nr:MAG TPA: hypothetical protein [Caudoviricetes sp.]
MKARLAKKIVKASPLYQWYCREFGKKPCKHQYWLQKWEIRRCIVVFHQKGKADYRLLVASHKADVYCRDIWIKIRTRRTLI